MTRLSIRPILSIIRPSFDYQNYFNILLCTVVAHCAEACTADLASYLVKDDDR